MMFSTELFLDGNTTGIKVPPDVVEALGAGKRPAVTVAINGSYTYRSTVAVMDGAFLIPFSAAHRAASGLRGGDPIDVELALDTAPREVEVPPALAVAFASDPAAKAAFEALSPSRRKAHALSIEDAKTEETRHRRVEKVLAELRKR